MAELFEIGESLSPREAWKRKHNITVTPPNFKNWPGSEWGACIIETDPDGKDAGDPPRYESHGETEEEALWNLAQSKGIEFYK